MKQFSSTDSAVADVENLRGTRSNRIFSITGYAIIDKMIIQIYPGIVNLSKENIECFSNIIKIKISEGAIIDSIIEEATNPAMVIFINSLASIAKREEILTIGDIAEFIQEDIAPDIIIPCND